MKLTNLSTAKPEGTAKGKYGDVKGTIQSALGELKPGEVIKVSDLVAVLKAKHKLPRNQAYVRVNNIIARTWFKKDFTKAWDKDGHTYLGRKEPGKTYGTPEKDPKGATLTAAQTEPAGK